MTDLISIRLQFIIIVLVGYSFD